MFNETRKSISDVKRAAHLWPPSLRGERSWWLKRLMNHDCRVSWRLSCHRFPGVVMKSQGTIIATAIREMPKYTGLMNCSKNPTGKFSLRG